MNPQRIGLIVLVPLLAGLTAFVHYSARGSYWLIARASGDPLSSVMALGTWAVIPAFVLAGVIAALVGGAPLVPLGLLLNAAGNTAVAAGFLGPGMVIASGGRGFVSVGLAAVAGRLFRGREESFRAAVFVAMYGAVNVGAMLAPLAGGTLAEKLGPSTAVGSAAALALLAGLAAIVLPVLEFTAPAPPEPVQRSQLHPTVLGVAVAALVLGAGAEALTSFANDLSARGGPDFGSATSWLFTSANPLSVVGVALVTTIGLAVAGSSGVQVPSLAVAGVGFLLCAVGIFSGHLGATISVYVVAQVIGGFSEPLAWGGLMASVTSGIHWRMMAMAAAIVSVAGYAAYLFSTFIPDTLASGASVLLAGGLVGVGLLFLIAAWPVKALLDGVWAGVDAEEEAADPGPNWV